jgi:iron(III) transport system permease protein
LVALAAAALVAAPLLNLLRIALSGGGADWAHLVATVLPPAVLDTVLLLGGVGALAGLIGTATAWLVTAHRFPGRDVLSWMLVLPLAVPTYIVAYIAVDVLDYFGPVQSALRSLFGWRSRAEYWFPEVRSLPGCIAVMSLVLYPYVYLSARAMFLTQSASMLEVARTLGAGRLELVRTVALPLARPALAVGVSLALLEALNDIGASEYLGVRTLTVTVYTTWLNRGSLPGAAQIACAMLLVVMALVALERRGRADRRYALSARRPRVAEPMPLPRGAGLAAALACAVPVLLGFVLPVAVLARETLARSLWEQVDAAFLSSVAGTVGLAAAATLAVGAVAVAVVAASRLGRSRATGAASFVAGLGYAVPGTVLALGLLGPLVAVDEGLNAVWGALTGERLGLVLMGSAAGVVIAYVIRFLPIATGSLSAGLDRVSGSLDDAARSLGASSRELIVRVQLPLMRPALAGAALLVFVDCLKELPATLLLRPLNVETLSTLVYGHASRGSFEDGALAALVIVLVGLWPVMRLTRRAEARPVARSPGA